MKNIIKIPYRQEMLDTIVEVIENNYAEDISIMFIYGSYVNGTANEKSDLDMIFIPKTDKAQKLSKTFIFDESGNDLWGSTWEIIERFANFDDMKVSVIADSQLVYYATEEDKKRYELLKKQALMIESGQLSKTLIEKAETHLKTAIHYFGELCLSDNLTCAGGILYAISDIICLLNHTFLHFGTKKMIEEMSVLKHLPDGFISAFKAVAEIENAEQAKLSCHTLINIVRVFLKQCKNDVVPPATFDCLNGVYEEISTHWNKIYLNCEKDNSVTTLLAAASLQNTIDDFQDSLGISMDDLRFINNFNFKNLNEFALTAKKAQQVFVELLKCNGIPIIEFNTISQLKMFLME